MAPAALLALFLLQPVGAGASAADPSPLGRCLDRSEAAAGAMPAIAACIEAEIVRRDRVLNAVYRARLARSGRAARARLVAAERRWIIRRDAACLPTDASQDAAIAARWCLLDRTEARIAALSHG